MAVVLGEGDYRYEVVGDWAKLPDGIKLGDVSDIGIDSEGNVYALNRSDNPMVVFDSDGNFLRTWGQGIFQRPHGLFIDPDDNLFCADDADHTVRKFDKNGTLLFEWGTPGSPSPYMSGKPFNRCTNTAVSPSGEIYISDGYGNARIHKYAADGSYITSWGEPGTNPGQFNVAHNIRIDRQGLIYVADRENHRIQVFDGEGNFLAQWNSLHRPCGLYVATDGSDLCYTAEAGSGLSINRYMPNIGPRVSILTLDGKIVAQLGNRIPGRDLDQFVAIHGVIADARGDIYVGETSRHSWPILFPDKPIPDDLITIRKLVKLN